MFNVIVNPRSGEGKKKKITERALARFAARGGKVRGLATAGAGDAKRLSAQVCAEGAGDLVVIGGDGTLHEALCGMSDFENTALGLVPAGTGNDFAAAANIPSSPEAAVDLILDTRPQYTDFLQLPNGVRGINAAGTGIDVEILKRCRASKILRGKFQYVISLVISLLKFKNYDLTARFNGKEERYSALIACVGNGHRIGGGIPMCPKANAWDGLADLVVVDDVKKSRIPAAFVGLMKGRILEEKFTRFERCTHVEVVPDRPLTVQVDGELYDDLPFVVDLVAGKLRMWRG